MVLVLFASSNQTLYQQHRCKQQSNTISPQGKEPQQQSYHMLLTKDTVQTLVLQSRE